MLITRASHIKDSFSLQPALLAGAISIVLHVGITYLWHPQVEPLKSNVPKMVEVALIKSPLPPVLPPPEVKPKEPKPKVLPQPSKPVLKKQVKPPAKLAPIAKAKTATKPKVIVPVKPIAPPKPVVNEPVKVKAPPKVLQKTFVQKVPHYDDNPTAKTVVPTPITTPAKPIAKPTSIDKPVAPVNKFVPPTPPKLFSASNTNNAKLSSTKADKGGQNSAGNSSGFAIVTRVEPKYPQRALDRHIEGRVVVEFTITTTGSVSDAVVVSADPEGIFNQAALAAIGRYRFKPEIVNGVAVKKRAKQTISFKLK